MSKLIKSGNVAVFEYPEGANDPQFTFDNGILFIYGYSFNFLDKVITVAKRFDLGLKDFNMFGEYKKVKEKIVGDISYITTNLDKKRCLIFTKTKN